MERTLENISEMGMKFNGFVKIYWKSVWIVVTPMGSIAVFIFILTDLGSTEFRDYVFPPWADILGWMFGLGMI